MKLVIAATGRRGLGLLLGVVLALSHAPAASAEPPAPGATMTREAQSAMTPAEALQRLKDGHARFQAGKPIARDLPAQVAATGGGQFPFASVVSCIDSRAAPELVFDQGIGDIFAPRIAGNFVDEEILGSLEFTAKVVGSKLIVVLGHTECGAVMGACDGVELGNLTATLAHLQPAVAAVTAVDGERSSKNPAFVEAVTKKNVELTLQEIRDRSPILREMEQKGEIGLAGAIYDVRTGAVTWL